MMVEVPAAAIAIDQFDADFYLHRLQRSRPVRDGGRPRHRRGRRSGRDRRGRGAAPDRQCRRPRRCGRAARCRLCGDAGGDPAIIPALLDCGVRTLSMSPALVASAKAAIADCSHDGRAADRTWHRDSPMTPKPDAVAAYKTILRDLDQRPSGTRQRLADALGKNRSLHLADHQSGLRGAGSGSASGDDISRSAISRRPSGASSSKAYRQAHPGRLVAVAEQAATARPAWSAVPDLGSEAKNRSLDRLLRTFAADISELVAEPDETPATQEPDRTGRRRTPMKKLINASRRF